MSLAPTLKTTLATAIGVGAVVVSGLAPTILTDRVSPSTATISAAGLLPTINNLQGPTAYPETGAVTLDGLAPGLWKMRVIYPLLPDAEGETNDLSPTLVENVIEPTAPDSAVLTISSLAPAVIGNGGQNIAVTSGLATISGLAPEVVLPAGEIIDRFPGKASLELIGLDPSLALEVTAGPESSALSISGLVPSLTVRYGWQTVSLSGSAVWTDVNDV